MRKKFKLFYLWKKKFNISIKGKIQNLYKRKRKKGRIGKRREKNEEREEN